MEVLREYVVSIVIAALICGILMSIVQESSSKVFIRMLCGIFLTITAIQPVAGWDIGQFLTERSVYSEYAEAAAVRGKHMSEQALADIIKENTQAYILDKATELNADITVTVFLNSERIPSRVALSGDISPHVQEVLESIIESDLGITKENQTWTG